jgi:hypothetical protein
LPTPDCDAWRRASRRRRSAKTRRDPLPPKSVIPLPSIAQQFRGT